jgi:hypothetical protein
MDISWLEFVRSHPDATYAVSWTPQSVAAFTTGWTVGIQPGRENRIADRIHSGEAPFASDDLSQFGQRDAPDDPGRYLRPDYWIYFPTDSIHTAEGLEPFCRQDYLVEAWQKMTASRDRPVVQVLTIRPDVTRPGSEVLIEARVTARPDLFDRLEVLQTDVAAKAHENRVIGQLRYDCASRSARGRIHVPPDLIPAQDHETHDLQFPLQVRYKDGRRFITGVAALTVGNDVKEPAIPDREPEPQPSAASLASALSQLPRAADGASYVIFDLRPLYHGNLP